jgi:putative transposase
MSGPRSIALKLSDREVNALEELTHRHCTAQQVALRARIILAAEAGMGNTEIGHRLGISVDMVQLWRARWRSVCDVPWKS